MFCSSRTDRPAPGWYLPATALLLLTSLLPAQEALSLPRLSGPVVLDGLSNEPAWEAIPPLPLTMHAPVFRGRATERTEIRVAYDDDYLYLAGRLFDSQPEAAGVADLTRDSFTPNNDYFGLVLDTFNDNENALGFFTTPAGIRWDAAIFNDAEGDFPINVSWNTFWDVAVVQNGAGWFAELRIPFSSLRFQEEDGQVIMGFATWRYISRKFENVSFPAMDPAASSWALFKASNFRKVRLEGVTSKFPAIITPYLLGGVGQAAELNAGGSAYESPTDLAREVGLDVKLSLSSNLTLDLTANTDFAQVEADDEQVNLTRFSLFFPEKRLFFQERSAIFDFSLGGPNRLFYSRRIGIHDDGRPVPIYGGARLVGRLGDWDLGVISMQTAPLDSLDDSPGLPSENFGVVRLRRRVLNPYSYAGGMLTSRTSANGNDNLAYALDGTVRVTGDNYLILNWAQTFNSDTPSGAAPGLWEAARLRLSWQRRTLAGLGLDVGISREGADYDPQLGFRTRDDYTRIGTELSYGWFPGEASTVFHQSLGINGSIFMGNADGSVESLEVGPRWSLGLKTGLTVSAGVTLLHEDLADDFPLDEDSVVTVPAGRYTFVNANATYFSAGGRKLFLEGSLDAGSFYDGWRVSLAANPVYTVSRHLEVSGGIVLNLVRFPIRDMRYDTQVLRLRVRSALSTAVTLSALVQYNSAADIAIINGRFRYNPREGTDLYLVVNQGLNTAPQPEEPALPFSTSRTVLLKYSTSFLPLLPWAGR